MSRPSGRIHASGRARGSSMDGAVAEFNRDLRRLGVSGFSSRLGEHVVSMSGGR